MPAIPAVLLECQNCHAIIDFSKPNEPDSHVLCPKCGHDFGTYRKVIDGANRAIEQHGLSGPKSPKH